MNKKIIGGAVVIAALSLVGGNVFGVIGAVVALGLGLVLVRDVKNTQTGLEDSIESLDSQVSALTDQNTKAEAIASRYLLEREEFKQKYKDAVAKVEEQTLLNSIITDNVEETAKEMVVIKTPEIKSKGGKVAKKKIIK